MWQPNGYVLLRRLEEGLLADARLEALGKRHGDIGESSDVGERLATRGRPFHGDRAVLEHEVVFVRFEQGGGELGHLALRLRPGHVQRRAADCLRPAAERADPLFHDARVAVKNRDVLERDAELVGQHLGERRLVSLSVR